MYFLYFSIHQKANSNLRYPPLQNLALVEKPAEHRVGRVLSFFSSRRIWDSPTPSPVGKCAPPFGSGGGAQSLAREGVGESHFRGGDINSGTLYIYVLCAAETQTSIRLARHFLVGAPSY